MVTPPDDVVPTRAPSPRRAQQQSDRNGLALTSLLVGIVAFALGLVPIVGIFLGLISAIFGIVALLGKQSRMVAVTGLILAACAIVASSFTTAALYSINA